MLTEERAREILRKAGVTSKVALVGIRGYYQDSMGEPGQNDRGIYDDCIALVTPGGIRTFNANTDPSIGRRGIAVLKPGVHPFRKGRHGISKPGGGYWALRPATPGERLPVVRDGQGESTGIAINIHKGSFNSTSSEGCQTIYPLQWTEFLQVTYRAMDVHGVPVIPYVLVEGQG